MFSKCFGGNKQQGSQPQPQQQPVEQATEQDQLQYTKTINLISQQIAILEQSQDKYQLRLEKIENDIRLLVAAKKKNQAKTKILEIKEIQQSILSFEKKKNVFLEMKMQLELAKGNSMSLIVVENVNKLFSQNRSIQDGLTNALDDYKEHQQDQNIDNLRAGLHGDQDLIYDDLTYKFDEMQLEITKGNSVALIVVENVNKQFNQKKTIQDNLKYALDDYKEYQNYQEIDQQWLEDIGDQEIVEEEYAQYMKEIEQKESQKFQNRMNQMPSINIPQQQQQKLKNNNINNAWQAQMNS